MDILLYHPQRTTIHLSLLDLLFSPENFVWNLRTLVIFEDFNHLEILEMQYFAQTVCPGSSTWSGDPSG